MINYITEKRSPVKSLKNDVLKGVLLDWIHKRVNESAEPNKSNKANKTNKTKQVGVSRWVSF